MALPELAVMQQAFELLHPLDPKARHRVLKWVKAALEEADPVPAPAEDIDAGVRQESEPEPVAGESVPADDGTAPPDDRDEPPTPASPSTEPAPEPTPTPTPTPTPAPEPAPEPEPAPAPAPTAGRTGRRAAKANAKTAAKAGPKPGRGRAKTKADTPAAATAATAPAVPAAGGRGRPPAEEIMRVYQQADGKLTEVAKHFGKPYGTIQGWASALREQGYPIGRSRKS